MASGRITREYCTISKQFSTVVHNLSQTVDPGNFAQKLFEANLVSSDVVQKACVVGLLTPPERIRPLILAVLAQIELRASTYHQFISILKGTNSLLADTLSSFFTTDLELNVVSDLSELSNWQGLGRQLNIDPVKLKLLNELQRSGRDSERCKEDLLMYWVKSDPSASWQKLAEALDQIEEHGLCQRIRDTFVQPQSHEQGDDSQKDMTTDDKVLTEVKKFDARFERLVNETRDELEEKQTPVKRFRNSLTYLPVHVRSEHLQYIKENLDDIKKAGNIEELFLNLNLYWTFIDYSLLEHLIETYGSDGLKQQMSKYVKDVNVFKEKTTFGQLIKCWPGRREPPPHFSRVTSKLEKDASQYTLAELERFRKEFCCEFQLSTLMFMLAGGKDCSIIVFWYIPSSLVPKMTGIDLTDSSWFEQHGILELEVDGICLFQKQQQAAEHSLFHSSSAPATLTQRVHRSLSLNLPPRSAVGPNPESSLNFLAFGRHRSNSLTNPSTSMAAPRSWENEFFDGDYHSLPTFPNEPNLSMMEPPTNTAGLQTQFHALNLGSSPSYARMASGKGTCEYRTVSQQLTMVVSSLARTVDPSNLAQQLHEADIIGDDVVERACVMEGPTPTERVRPVMGAVLGQIELSASTYHRFIDILRELNPLLADTLSKSFYEAGTARSLPTKHRHGSSNGEGIFSDRDLASLMDLLRGAAPCWKNLGLCLGIRRGELESIERRPLLIPEGCLGYLREMLSQWLKWAPPNHPLPTVFALASALRRVGEDSVAFHLETFFRGEGNVDAEQMSPFTGPTEMHTSHPPAALPTPSLVPHVSSSTGVLQFGEEASLPSLQPPASLQSTVGSSDTPEVCQQPPNPSPMDSRSGTTTISSRPTLLDDMPSMMEIIAFKVPGKTQERLDISQRIGTYYRRFGTLLLKDHTGARVSSIVQKHLNNPAEINYEIVTKWLEGEGEEPVTWRTLCRVLDDIGLRELARIIIKAKH